MKYQLVGDETRALASVVVEIGWKIYCVIALPFRLAFVSSQTSVWRAHGTEKNISNAVCTLGECFLLRAASSSPSDLLRSSIAREEIQKSSTGPKATREIFSLATANGSRPRRLCASMFSSQKWNSQVHSHFGLLWKRRGKKSECRQGFVGDRRANEKVC